MKYIVTFFLFLVFTNNQAQQSPSAVPKSSAPANASVAYVEKWTAFHNPSILSSKKKKQFSIIYDNNFELKEISTKSISAGLPTKLLDFGTCLSYFGCQLYNEIQLGLTFSKKFSSKLNIGVQCNYYSISISKSKSNKGCFVTQIGILSKLSSKLHVGFHAYNPTQSILKTEELRKRIPSVFSIGTSYHINNSLSCYGQLDKEIEYNLIWRFGFEYYIKKRFFISIGGSGNPFIPCLGTGILYKQIRIDLNFERHQLLGINSQLGLSYSFK